ncbi:GNAT family N-acetyltransferase [Novosphingobium tardum]|uniref:GNAT family N-acetyltransferase n=1 Tax=Novosphingobium tardum TaxID=1538021 RepID=A0ABV8RLN1_9SPHN
MAKDKPARSQGVVGSRQKAPAPVVARDDPARADVAALLAFHHAQMLRWSPPDKVHVLPASCLSADDVSFFSARVGGTLAGFGALREIEAGHGEIKSMRVDPAFLGTGVGEAILLHILEAARAAGLARLSLETGRPEPFLPAQRLYEKHGFAPCRPFGDYVDDGFSMCMTRAL